MPSTCVPIRSTMADQPQGPAVWDGEAFVRRLSLLMDREDLGTAEALARYVGVSKSTGYNWVAGKSVSVASLRQIGRSFGVAMEWLCGEGEDAAPIPAPTSRAQAEDPIETVTGPRTQPGRRVASRRRA